MNSNSGNVMYLKFNAYPVFETIKGKKTVVKMIIANIIVNAAIRNLTFNENTPIKNIKERLYYVNVAELFFQNGGWNE